MAQLPDGSERIRIKVDVAKRVREVSSDLNMSFLEVLYHAFNLFYLQHHSEKRKFKAESQTTIEPKEEKKSVRHDVDSEDTCEIDLDF